MREHRERRTQILSEKERSVIEKFQEHAEKNNKITEMQKQLLVDIRNSLMSSGSSHEQTANFKAAREADDLFRSTSAESMMQKLDKSENHLKRLKDEENDYLQRKQEKQALQEFRCEQRRRLQLIEREQKAALLKIQLESLNAHREIHESINYQRPNALRQVFHQHFDACRPKGEVTYSPGPGDYEVDLQRKIKGGYMSGKLKSTSVVNITPGPGQYEPPENLKEIFKLKETKGNKYFSNCCAVVCILNLCD